MAEHFIIYQDEKNGRWRARFSNEVVSKNGEFCQYAVSTQFEETAEHIAVCIVRDTLKKPVNLQLETVANNQPLLII